MKGSYVQTIKRRAMKEGGLTFAQRLAKAVRSGTKVSDVVFKVEGKKVLAVAKP